MYKAGGVLVALGGLLESLGIIRHKGRATPGNVLVVEYYLRSRPQQELMTGEIGELESAGRTSRACCSSHSLALEVSWACRSTISMGHRMLSGGR